MARTKQTARKSTGGRPNPKTVGTARTSLPTRKGAPRPPSELRDTRTDPSVFGTLDDAEPIEYPHGARDVRCTADTATAYFDIGLEHLNNFDNIDQGRFARHQISEPFVIGGLWWVLGIDKKTTQFSSRSRVVAHLFCVSLQYRLSGNNLHSFPLRWKINRSTNVFDAESGEAFQCPGSNASASLVQMSGSFAFLLETGNITGTSANVDFGGQLMYLHGAAHQPICGDVLLSLSENEELIGDNKMRLTVKFLGDLPVLGSFHAGVAAASSNETTQDKSSGDGKEQGGNENEDKDEDEDERMNKKPRAK